MGAADGVLPTGHDANDTLPEGVRRSPRSAHDRRLLVGVTGSGNRNLDRYHQPAAGELAARSGGGSSSISS